MQHEKYRHFTSPLSRPIQNGEREGTARRIDSNAQTPRSKHEPILQQKREGMGQTAGDLFHLPSHHPPATFTPSSEDKRLRLLITDAISSADRAIKAILPYGHLEIQKYCSVYFLNKEKLISFLDTNNQSFFSNFEQNSKRQKKKHKKRQEISSELIEMVPINHLERLQKIVYNKIIPILQVQLESEKRKSQKQLKKGKEWNNNSDLKEGLVLLERLHEKERIAVDQCAEILEKFIIRIMEKEEKMLTRLSRLQEKLDQEIKKTELLAQQSKKWQQFRLKTEKEWGRQKKTLLKYQQFSKEVKSILSEKEKVDSHISQKEGLESLLQHIKRLADDRKHSKKCDHRSHKEIHNNCKEESSRNEQQIKSLKDVVKSLDNEICLLREECESMENQLKENHEKTNKVQIKSKKVIQENQSMNQKIDQLIREDNYKGKLIEQYLRIISRLEQSLKTNEDTIGRLNEENEGYQDMLNKYSSEKEDYIRHIMEIEEKEKELQEIIARKEIEIEELIIHLNSKDREVSDSENIIQKMQGEIHSLYGVVKAKEEAITAQTKENQELKEQLKEQQKVANLKGSSHQDLSIQEQQKEKGNLSSNNFKNEPKTAEELFLTQQHISESMKQGKAERQVSMSPDSKNPLQQMKSQLKKISHENSTLKFELQRIKTFKAIQQSTNEAFTLNCHEREQLNYLRSLVHNLSKISRQHKLLKSGDASKVKLGNTQLPATLIEQINDAALQYNKKGIERDDFIPANVNKQTEEQVKKQDKSHHHKLNEEFQALQPRLFQEIAHEIQVQNDELVSEDLIEIEKIQRDDVKVEGQNNEVEPSRIQELLDLNVQIGENFIKLKQKIEKQQKYSEELTQIKQQIDYMTALLNIYKHNTLKKLQKLKKTELLHKEAQEEVERLKHRLDDAIGAIHPFSSIRTNSQGSGFSMPDHLQSFFKHNNPFIDQHNYNTEYHATHHKPSREFFTQTEDERASERNRIPAVAAESEVIIHTSSPLVSEIEDRPAGDVTKSFIDQLEMISPPAQEKTARIESLVDNGNIFLTPEVLRQIPVDANPESSQSMKKESQVRQIGNMIDYHKDQLINLHKILRANSEELISQQRQGLETPKRHPFQNEEYLRYITNAPQKEKNQSSLQDKDHKTAYFHITEMEEIKEMFTQREQELSQLLHEKDQEIERLKSIIKTLTKVQEVEDKSSIKGSRNRESATRELQNLKNENEHLWMFLEKEKSEIERLRILIQQYQLTEELYKIRNAPSPQKNQEQVTYDILMHRPIGGNEKIFYDMTPAKQVEKRLEEVEELQAEQLTKSQNLDVEVENHELLVDSSRKAKEEPPISTPLKVEESPTKRFARKSEKFEQEESPRQRRHTSPSKTLQMDWQQLVPQYFGDKPKRSSPRHSDHQ